MTRIVTVGAAQLGPIARDEPRKEVVERLLALLHAGAHDAGCELVVFPELALTTFFPRWFVDDQDEIDALVRDARCRRRRPSRCSTRPLASASASASATPS